MKKSEIHVGGTLRDAKKRVLKAVRNARRGHSIVENHVTFENWDALVKVMTAKRLELLRHLHQNPAKSIRSLAQRLHRDYKRVHADVSALSSIGLVGREGTMLRADYKEIRTRIPM